MNCRSAESIGELLTCGLHSGFDLFDGDEVVLAGPKRAHVLSRVEAGRNLHKGIGCCSRVDRIGRGQSLHRIGQVRRAK